jgi:hyperosmotically inducible periplasmic protein
MIHQKHHYLLSATLAGLLVVAGGSAVYAQSSSAPADNSAQNAQDRNHQTLTPVDQSNKPEDLAISRQIRRSIVKDRDLSSDAKNIKIITIDRTVTLRGVVKTDSERTSVEARAADVAGAANVHNELEVAGQ